MLSEIIPRIFGKLQCYKALRPYNKPLSLFSTVNKGKLESPLTFFKPYNYKGKALKEKKLTTKSKREVINIAIELSSTRNFQLVEDLVNEIEMRKLGVLPYQTYLLLLKGAYLSGHPYVGERIMDLWERSTPQSFDKWGGEGVMWLLRSLSSDGNLVGCLNWLKKVPTIPSHHRKELATLFHNAVRGVEEEVEFVRGLFGEDDEMEGERMKKLESRPIDEKEEDGLERATHPLSDQEGGNIDDEWAQRMLDQKNDLISSPHILSFLISSLSNSKSNSKSNFTSSLEKVNSLLSPLFEGSSSYPFELVDLVPGDWRRIVEGYCKMGDWEQAYFSLQSLFDLGSPLDIRYWTSILRSLNTHVDGSGREKVMWDVVSDVWIEGRDLSADFIIQLIQINSSLSPSTTPLLISDLKHYPNSILLPFHVSPLISSLEKCSSFKHQGEIVNSLKDATILNKTLFSPKSLFSSIPSTLLPPPLDYQDQGECDDYAQKWPTPLFKIVQDALSNQSNSLSPPQAKKTKKIQHNTHQDHVSQIPIPNIFKT